jgi:LacI family transcriptional regulator
MEVAKQLGYRPPHLRKSRHVSAGTILRTPGKSAASRETIGFQFFTATNSPGDTIARNTFYLPVLVGAQAEASALGMHLMLHSTNRHDLSVEVPKMVQEQAVGGMLLVGTADPVIFEIFARHVPNLVLVDSRDETGTLESVLSDGFGGAMLATRHLLELGHRRIAFLLPEPGVITFCDRQRGWLCAMYEGGAVPDPSWIFGTTEEHDVRTEMLRHFLETHVLRRPDAERLTAVVAANDQSALALMRACIEAGIRVPQDLSVVGFDDAEGAEFSHPALTTVRVDKEFMGRLAVRRLYARLHGEAAVASSQPQVRHEIPVSLVLRDSCRPL